MPTEVRYYCPRCETVVSLLRDDYLADKSVTPTPLPDWTYVAPDEPFEDRADVHGVRFVCGESAGADWRGDGCGEPFYLNFVRFRDGRELEPEPARESVTLADPNRPRGPRGPGGPGGPGRR